MNDFKYIPDGYVPKGEIRHLSFEIIDKMISYQTTPNIEIFEKNIKANRDEGGFDWKDTSEGNYFWEEIIVNKNISLFYKKYMSFSQRVIEVSDNKINWEKRVAFTIKKNKAFCWKKAENLEEAEKEEETTSWSYWREAEAEVEVEKYLRYCLWGFVKKSNK